MTKEWHGDDIAEEDVVLEAENNEPPKAKSAFGGSPDDSFDDESFRGDCEKRVAKLKAELEKVKAEKQENLDGWQRAKADYVNLLRRGDEAAKAAESLGKVKAVETLLPAFDALERAKEHGEVPEGFLAIAKQLESAFASLGLEAMGQVGEPFDPAVHEALGQDPADDKAKDDTITAVLEKGWRVNGFVIRPAKVRVAHYAQ